MASSIWRQECMRRIPCRQKPKDLFQIRFKYYVDYANYLPNHRETPGQDLFVFFYRIFAVCRSPVPIPFLVVNKVQRLSRLAPEILFTLREKVVDLDNGIFGNSRLESRSLRLEPQSLALTMATLGALTLQQLAINLMWLYGTAPHSDRCGCG